MRLLLSAALLSATAAASAQAVTIDSLLDEMLDRTVIAKLDNPAYSCVQASSYDRRTITPEDQNDWYANMDRSWFVRKETTAGRTEYVMMDDQGPGAVVRIWTTWHGATSTPNGIIRFYLDGSDKPVIEGRVIDIISGGALAGAPLSQSVSKITSINNRGHNLYLPIPYASGCKVTYESIKEELDDGAYKTPAFYYQINYRKYESGTEVESFGERTLAKSSNKINRTIAHLNNNSNAFNGTGRAEIGGAMKPGTSQAISIEEGAAIRELSLNLTAEDLEQALRSTVIEFSFDGRPTTWVPAGYLFGVGYKAAPYKSWWAEMKESGEMILRWPMPFRNSCKIKVINLGKQTVGVSLKASLGEWSWDERSLYFHANWNPRYAIDTQAGPSTSWLGAYDLNYTTVEGRGKWAGDLLALFNGTPAWWGEGDEKIWVDNEDFPSHVGTGTEDYYGYAWSNPNFFDAPFHAQPYGIGANRADYAVNLRWRSLDAIPFNDRIQFDMEVWHWVKTKMDFEPVSIFYARPGAVWNVPPKPAMAKTAVTKHVNDLIPPYLVDGAIEAESMELGEPTSGEVVEQAHPDLNWSNGLQVWWKFAEVGSSLTLTFDADKAGLQEVYAGLTIAVDYGIASFELNGQKLAQNLDLYSPDLDTKEFSLGKASVKEKGNVLVITLSGINEKAVKSKMIGIDYIRLED